VYRFPGSMAEEFHVVFYQWSDSLPTLNDEFVLSKSQTSGSKSVSVLNRIYTAPPLARGRLTARGRWT
jgi:hypothetical protein